MTSSSKAKHLDANTIGKFPSLFPYVLEHCPERVEQRDLRKQIEQLEKGEMAGSPDEAAFFGWLLPLLGAKKCIEIGVFRGSTTLALALALPADGKVIGLDVSSEYAETARPYWASAGVADKIDFRVGPAVASLQKLVDEGHVNSFDFVFIDADKSNYDAYYELALQLVKPGTGVIAVDNVLWSGRVHPVAPDASVDTRALANLNAKIKADKRVAAMMLPIADGVYLVRRI